MEVIIVSKTTMNYGNFCVGGIEVVSGKSIRLMKDDGNYQPPATPYKVGQIWNLVYTSPVAELHLPHTEDVFVTKATNTGKTFTDFHSLLNIPAIKLRTWKGHINKTFDKLLRWTNNRHGYISAAGGVPSCSTGFWIPDVDLTYDDSHYNYHRVINFSFSYKGLQNPVTIPAGTLVRLSLARWWKPKDVEIELRCYAQVSGWYL
ncbi:MAG: hypothetical protein JWN78_1966 [Bacteroidota bacterium]|nr:hypothetical protein [Bacteroidota bacterium]